jgi:hypothetical protein
LSDVVEAVNVLSPDDALFVLQGRLIHLHVRLQKALHLMNCQSGVAVVRVRELLRTPWQRSETIHEAGAVSP